MLKGLTKPINFKNELALANESFKCEQWNKALTHYKQAISEINRQLIENPDKSLPDFFIPVYTKAILALAECQLMINLPDDCLITLAHPLFDNSYNNTFIALQARAFLALGNKDKAIATLKKSVKPTNGQLDKYFIEAQISLSHLLFEKIDFISCSTMLRALLSQINSIHETQTKNSDHQIVLYKMQIQFHMALIYKASDSPNEYFKLIKLAYETYSKYLSRPSSMHDQDMNLMALSVVAEYLLSLKDKLDDEMPALGQSLVSLLKAGFEKTQEPIRIKAIQGLMLCIKYTYEHGSFSDGQVILNQVLVWIKQGLVPKSLISVISLLAANCYLQHQSNNLKLSAIFIDLALKYQIFLQPQAQDEVRMQALIMKLVCMQDTEDTEQRNDVFNQILSLRVQFPKDKLFALSKLIEKLLLTLPLNSIKPSDSIIQLKEMYFDILFEVTTKRLQDLSIAGNEDSCLSVLDETVVNAYQTIRDTNLASNSSDLVIPKCKAKKIVNSLKRY